MLDSQVLLTLTLTCKQKSALKLIDWAKAIPNNLPKKRPLVPEVKKDFFSVVIFIYNNHKKSQLSQKKHPIDFTCCELERRESIFLFKINQGRRVPRSKSQLRHLRPAIFFSPQYLCPGQFCTMFETNYMSVDIFGELGCQSPIIQ